MDWSRNRQRCNNMDQLTRDLIAGTNIILGLLIFIVSLQKWRGCRTHWKGIFLLSALAGLFTAGVFVLSLFRLYNGGDALDPLAGRPAFTLLQSALVLVLLHNQRMGDC